jgi:hypothetical protein
LKAGSQPPPGFYFTAPLYYRHSDVSIFDAQGNQVLKHATPAFNLFMLPSVQWVTPFKVFGAKVGVSPSQWILNGVFNQATANFQRSTSYGFGDIYVQPLVLGWHTPRADVTAGYAFFAPTGSGFAGRHMWVDEIDFGTTLYLDSGKKYNASVMMFYDFKNKNNTNITVGDIVALSGGIGRSFLKGAANAGVAYGAQWKTPTIVVPNYPDAARSVLRSLRAGSTGCAILAIARLCVSAAEQDNPPPGARSGPSPYWLINVAAADRRVKTSDGTSPTKFFGESSCSASYAAFPPC